MDLKPRFTVIGAGHGGKAMAADLAVKGFEVTLFNRTPERINEIALTGEIDLEYSDGSVRSGKLTLVTSNIADALEGADVIMVVVPASGHGDVARKCAGHLRKGQIVVLNPGRTGGALEFRRILDQEGCAEGVIVSEAGTFIFVSRSTGPAQARIFRRKNSVRIAALPSNDTQAVIEVLHKAYLQFIPAKSVLNTSLDNMGTVFHPALTLLNTNWIERTKGDFQFYIDGVTPPISNLLEVIDEERLSVAEALGVKSRSALEWLNDAYSAKGDSIYEAIQANAGYQGLKAPRSIRHRFIFEDVPFSIVPMVMLGRKFGVDMWAMEALAKLAGIMHGRDFFKDGRTMEDMGLDKLNVDGIKRYVMDGVREQAGNGKSSAKIE